MWPAPEDLEEATLYLARALDQFENGFADTMFSVYLLLRLRARRPGRLSAFAGVRFFRTLAARENWEN